MTYTDANKRATMKYLKANYENLYIRVKKGKKEEYKKHAENQGESLSAFIIRAIEEQIIRDSQ
jgi:predicted HicB family RNase H-like nuclease